MFERAGLLRRFFARCFAPRKSVVPQSLICIHVFPSFCHTRCFHQIAAASGGPCTARGSASVASTVARRRRKGPGAGRGKGQGEQRAHLLDTVPDRRQLVRKVLTASLGGVKRTGTRTCQWRAVEVRAWRQRMATHVALNRHPDAAAHGAVTMPAAQSSSLQGEGRRVRTSRGVGTVADQGEQNARIRDTPSSASRIGDGESESRRPQARNAGKRQKRTWHALQQADVEAKLVPLHDSALDANCAQERSG